MKKIYILFVLLAWGLVACQDDDSVFEDSSSVRVNRVMEECEAMLKQAEHGWRMVYVPNPTKHGGFNVLMKFEDNSRVKMLTDFVEDETNTTYSFNASQGAVLSFDTYSCLHYLADPSVKPLGTGMEGEFEFVIQKITTDSIVFTGKKYGYKAVCVPATAEDWTVLIPAAKYNLEKLTPLDNAPFFRSLTMNTTAVNFVFDPSTRSASVTWADPVNRKTETFLASVYGTREGVGFLPAMKINGVVVDGLKYDENKGCFKVSAPGVIGTLEYTDEPPIPFYHSFTDLSTQSNSVALPLIGSFGLSINTILEVMNVSSAMNSMSADLRPSYPIAVLAGMKQFKISWYSPAAEMEKGSWLTYFGANVFFNEGEYYYHEGINFESLREEGDQVRFTANGKQWPLFAPEEEKEPEGGNTVENEEDAEQDPNITFAQKMQRLNITKVYRDFFTDPAGFTVVPAGNDKFYFVSIANSKRWMLLSKN